MDDLEQQTYDQYIKGVMDISCAITSELYLEDLLKLIVMVTANVTGVAICSLWLIDESEQPPQIRLKATQAISPEYFQDRSLGLSEGIVGAVINNKDPITIKNVMESKRFKEKAIAEQLAEQLELVSMAGIPLKLKDNRVIGVLNCFTTTPHDFSNTEINLLTTVANQAAVAILNTELMDQTKVIQEELESRKLIERAKEVLMLHRKMTGDKARMAGFKKRAWIHVNRCARWPKRFFSPKSYTKISLIAHSQFIKYNNNYSYLLYICLTPVKNSSKHTDSINFLRSSTTAWGTT